MWFLFKIFSLIAILTSTYMWITTFIPIMPAMAALAVALTLCMGLLPFKITFGRTFGAVLTAILGLTLWSMWIDGIPSGILTFIQYYPALLLILLPKDYQRDLLASITKWYAILILIALGVYALSFVTIPPSLSDYVHPNYSPFRNYIFYIQNTTDTGLVPRFNAFFLEPGHQALVSTFLLMANGFDFRRNRYCYILLAAVLCSFSLAGYLLTAVGWALLWTDNIKKALVVIGVMGAFVGGVLIWNGGDNDMYELIIGRLEYDEQKGIKGNNRVNYETDYVFEKAQKEDRTFTGVKGYANMKLIEGAGFKIYVLKYGWFGVFLAAMFYLSVIPPRFNVKYTLVYLTVLTLCFAQRAYPFWYSWILPYILGIYIHRKDDYSIEIEAPDQQVLQIKD